MGFRTDGATRVRQQRMIEEDRRLEGRKDRQSLHDLQQRRFLGIAEQHQGTSGFCASIVEKGRVTPKQAAVLLKIEAEHRQP